MQSILDQRFTYTPAAKTDIRARFAVMGWVPPSKAKRPHQDSAEQRLARLRADIDLLGTFSRDGSTVTFNASDLEAALARADGFGG